MPEGTGLCRSRASVLEPLTGKFVNGSLLAMMDVDVISDPATAEVALEPMRSRLLSELAEPASAAALAVRVGMSRQKVNYHLRKLEACGLVEPAGERQWGGLTERLLVASARSFVVSPEALGSAGADPAKGGDRLAASYLVALGARIVREVGDLWRRAREADKHLATMAIDTEVRFATPADRAAFTRELTQAVTDLVSRYHDEEADGGRDYRLVAVAHPTPKEGKGD
jgi:DNA-binding transcriptional ArsR family regulator